MMNKLNLVGIRTPNGLTERVNIKDIVQQGWVWGPILCSNHTDTLGRKCEERKITFYKYKGVVNIPPVTYVDDMGGIAKCGEDSSRLNVFLTTQIETKKLKFNEGSDKKKGKCFKMHVGKEKDKCKKLKVHKECLTEVEEITNLVETLTNDAKNSKHIKIEDQKD